MDLYYTSYREYKMRLDVVIKETASNFVMIGHLLRQARDTNILQESGYTSMGEFARKEYGLDETAASRFISIDEKFGNGTGRLAPQYEAFGYSKLSEMLTLPDSVAEVLPPEITRDEIREIKKEVQEEEKITPLEVMMEPSEEKDLLERWLDVYLQGSPAEYKAIYGALQDRERNRWPEAAAGILAPNGMAVLMARVPAVGRIIIRIDGTDRPAKMTNVRENSTEEISWEEFTESLQRCVLGLEAEEKDPEEAWADKYGLPFPEEIMPAQEKPAAGSGKPAKKKTSVKIARAQEPKKQPEKKAEKTVADMPGMDPDECRRTCIAAADDVRMIAVKIADMQQEIYGQEIREISQEFRAAALRLTDDLDRWAAAAEKTGGKSI